MDCPKMEPRHRKRFFSFPKRSDRLRGLPSLLFNRYRGSFPGLKRPGREINLWSNLLPRLRMNGATPLFSHMSSWRRQGHHSFSNFYHLFRKFFFILLSKVTSSPHLFPGLYWFLHPRCLFWAKNMHTAYVSNAYGTPYTSSTSIRCINNLNKKECHLLT